MSDHIACRNTAMAVIEGYRRICHELEAENEALRLLTANIQDLDALLRKLEAPQRSLREAHMERPWLAIATPALTLAA